MAHVAADQFYGTGRRKTSTARVWLTQGGKGDFVINGRALNDYFPRECHRMAATFPLIINNLTSQFDIRVNVAGGGSTGQAEAIRHGVSRALLEFQSDLRGPLKKAGFLTRDSRKKERKKYGMAGARKRFQYSKR